jgi:hypothetical protein
MKRTTLGKTVLRLAVTLLTVALLAPESSGTPDPASENFTGISTAGQLGGSFPFFSDYVLNGPITIASPQHRKTTNLLYTTAGLLDGEGIAAFGVLKSRVLLDGPAALNGNSSASFNDHWTVTNPSIPNGTPGTMQLAFNLSGMTTVLDFYLDPVASDQFSSLSLVVDLDPSSTSNGTRVLEYFADLNPGPTQVVAMPGGPTVTVPFGFTYGVPFGVRTSLGVWASTDNHYLWTSFSPYFEYYGGGTIGSVTIDFLSTAELAAVVIPDDPLASVVGGSSTDYSPLVTDRLVPEPASLAILLLGGIGFLRRRTN